MQCYASDSVGLIFTRSHRSTLLITTPTTTPSKVKTSLQRARSMQDFAYEFSCAVAMRSSNGRERSTIMKLIIQFFENFLLLQIYRLYPSRLRVVPLSLSPSHVTRKETARKKWPRGGGTRSSTRDPRPQDLVRSFFFSRRFFSRHVRRTKRKRDYSQSSILPKTATMYFGNVFYSDHNKIALVFTRVFFVLTLTFPLDAGLLWQVQRNNAGALEALH